ncbi:N-acetyltransferase [bacterium]|nr:N-acetyltransferase [bacterium]
MQNIRKAKLQDAKTIQALIKEYADENLLLPRSLSNIYETIRDFCVCEYDNKVVGCSALHIVWEDLAEIRSLVVTKNYQGKQIGKTLVNFCLKEAKDMGCSKIFALTYQGAFFEKLGFEYIEKECLPHKIWSDCINCVKFPDCNEIAMMKKI